MDNYGRSNIGGLFVGTAKTSTMVGIPTLFSFFVLLLVSVSSFKCRSRKELHHLSLTMPWPSWGWMACD